LQNFERHGYGTYTYANKAQFRGYWSNNEKNGSGNYEVIQVKSNTITEMSIRAI